MFVQALEPGGGVHRIARGRVVVAHTRAEIADHGRPCMNADAGAAEGNGAGILVLAEAIGKTIHLKGAFHCRRRVVRQIDGGVEDCEDRIANEFVYHAPVLLHDLGHAFEVSVQDARQLFGLDIFGHRREVGDVGKEKRHGPALAFERRHLRRIVDDLLHDFGGHMMREHALDEFALRPRLAAAYGLHGEERHRQRETGRNRSHQRSALIEQRRSAGPENQDKNEAQSNARRDRQRCQAKQGAKPTQCERHRQIGLP